MLCKRCAVCSGAGFLGVSTASNPSQYYSGSGAGAGTPCPSCVRGFVIVETSEAQIVDWLKSQLAMLLPSLSMQLETMLFPSLVHQLQNGPLRAKFFDSFVAEVEQRIKDVELKILDGATWTHRPYETGDRVVFCGTRILPGNLIIAKGTIGTVSGSSQSPPGHWSIFVRFQTFDADVAVEPADIRKEDNVPF